MIEDVICGTEKAFKLLIHSDEFEVGTHSCTIECFCTPSVSITVDATQMTKNTEENSISFVVDTSKVGCGRLKCRISLEVPDNTTGMGEYRTEIFDILTKVNIVSGLK